MVVLAKDAANCSDSPYSFSCQETFERIRPSKQARPPQKNKRGGGVPGSSRLRRNKHWSW